MPTAQLSSRTPQRPLPVPVPSVCAAHVPGHTARNCWLPRAQGSGWFPPNQRQPPGRGRSPQPRAAPPSSPASGHHQCRALPGPAWTLPVRRHRRRHTPLGGARIRSASLGSARRHSVSLGTSRCHSDALGVALCHSVPLGVIRMRSVSLAVDRLRWLLSHSRRSLPAPPCFASVEKAPF